MNTPYTNTDQEPALCWAHQCWEPTHEYDRPASFPTFGRWGWGGGRGGEKAERGQQPVSVEAAGKRMDRDSGPMAVATSALGPRTGEGFGEPLQGPWGHPGTAWPLSHQQGGSPLLLVDQETMAQRE